MSTSALQSLASRRDRRPPKPTPRIQQMLDQKQEQVERVEETKKKAKGRALVKKRGTLIHAKGDELMYGPVKGHAAPTLTGDDDSDDKIADAAEARVLLRLLAHRGDGDWSVHFNEGLIGLADLRKAHDHPGKKTIDRTIGELALTSAKGKGKERAVDSFDDGGGASSGQHSTVYSGITIGRSPPGSSAKPDKTPAAPWPKNLSAGTSITAKRQLLAYDNPFPSKKPRTDEQRPQQSSAQRGSDQRGVVPATVPVKASKLTTSLDVVAFGSRAAVIPGSRPSSNAVQPRPRKPASPNQDHRPDPPRPSEPRVPRSPAPLPPTEPAPTHASRKHAQTTWSPDYVPQPQASRREAAVSARLKNDQPDLRSSLQGAKARIDAVRDERVAASRNENAMRRPATIDKGKGAQVRDVKPRDNSLRINTPRIDTPRVNTPRVDTPRVSTPRVDKPQTDRSLKKSRPDKPQPDKPRPTQSQLDQPQSVRSRPAQSRPVQSRPIKPHGDAPRSDKSRGNRAQDLPKPPASQCRGKDRPAPPARQQKVPAQQRRPAHEPQHRRLNHEPQHRRLSHDGHITSEDEEDEENEEDEERRSNMADDYLRIRIPDSGDRPTVGSFEPRERKVVKLMIKKAKPRVIASGTFSWRVGDPGEAMPDIDNMASTSFVIACRIYARRFPFLPDHVTCLKILLTTYRHLVKQEIVLLVAKHLGFDNDDQSYNRKLVRWLVPDAFHEADPDDNDADRHPFESVFIFLAVACTLFGPGQLGFKHPDEFRPVPIRYLAFICAMCNHVIYCFRGGSFDRNEHLKASVQEQAFQQYLGLLAEMQRERPRALRWICMSMYNKGRAKAGYAAVVQAPRPPRRWAPDVAEPYVPRFAVPARARGNDTDRSSSSSSSADSGQARFNHSKGRPHRKPEGTRKGVASNDDDGDDHDYDDEYDDNHGEGPSKPRGTGMSGVKGWPEPKCEERDEREPSDEEMNG